MAILWTTAKIRFRLYLILKKNRFSKKIKVYKTWKILKYYCELLNIAKNYINFEKNARRKNIFLGFFLGIFLGITKNFTSQDITAVY